MEYESRSVNIRPEMKAMYNEACDVWFLVGIINTQEPLCLLGVDAAVLLGAES